MRVASSRKHQLLADDVNVFGGGGDLTEFAFLGVSCEDRMRDKLDYGRIHPSVYPITLGYSPVLG